MRSEHELQGFYMRVPKAYRCTAGNIPYPGCDRPEVVGLVSIFDQNRWQVVVVVADRESLALGVPHLDTPAAHAACASVAYKSPRGCPISGGQVFQLPFNGI
jgi:hypothetical protein